MEAFGVEPVDPLQGREFDVVDGVPWSLPADQFGLVEPVDGLSESVVIGVCDGPDRGQSAELGEAFAVADRRELRPGIGVTDETVEHGPAVEPGVLERVQHHLGAHVRGDGPTNDGAREHVGDEARVDHP
ncbi:MAG: hypothetical protein JWN62_1600 [Acidimicrobiales bacterium]|nr:hypothetical protein [Acidimicrobiales bacterium]